MDFDDRFYRYEDSFKKLSDVSDVAKLYYKGYDFFFYTITEGDEEGFHPTGKCGCVELKDTYFLGICCNHFMWAEGWNEFYYIEDENGNFIDNCLYIYGNHKGNFVSSVIVFCKREEYKNNSGIVWLNREDFKK